MASVIVDSVTFHPKRRGFLLLGPFAENLNVIHFCMIISSWIKFSIEITKAV
jgi:hypothetical protein